jgi:hypothetical protein
MSLFDFFFPEQAQAVHLRSIAQSARSQDFQRSKEIFEKRRESFRDARPDQRVEKLQRELEQSALVIESLISLLEDKKILTRQECQLRIAQIDSADGVVDGRITPEDERPDHRPVLPKRDWPG